MLLCSPPTPCPLRPWLRFPLPAAYLDAGTSSVLICSAADTCARIRVVCRRRVTGSPQHRDWSRKGEGLPGYWTVLFGRAVVEHPAGYAPSSPYLSETALLPSGHSAPWASGKNIGFGAASPRPTRSYAYASPAFLPRPSQGLLPTRAGSPFAGRVSHPLDDQQSFMESSHPPIPFDQQSLVALNCLYSEGTSLTLICAKGTVAMGWR